MCKKNPSQCKAKIKCKHCINTIDKIEEHDKIDLDIQEVDKLYIQVENIIVVK